MVNNTFARLLQPLVLGVRRLFIADGSERKNVLQPSRPYNVDYEKEMPFPKRS